jgi:hypothetical protein
MACQAAAIGFIVAHTFLARLACATLFSLPAIFTLAIPAQGGGIAVGSRSSNNEIPANSKKPPAMAVFF